MPGIPGVIGAGGVGNSNGGLASGGIGDEFGNNVGADGATG